MTIEANAGDDVVCLGDGDYGFTVHGGDGNDSIEGIGEVYGEAGDDTLTLLPTAANSGATLDGGPGDDVLDASREPNRTTPGAAVSACGRGLATTRSSAPRPRRCPSPARPA